jgi:hypothetical protein
MQQSLLDMEFDTTGVEVAERITCPHGAWCSRRPPAEGDLTFDIETIPDLGRIDDLQLEPLPEVREEKSVEEMEKVDLGIKVSEMPAFLEEHNPCDEWLDWFCVTEDRVGSKNAIAKFRKQRAAIANAENDRYSKMSVNPRHARIATIGYAMGSGTPVTRLISHDDYNYDCTEEAALRELWEIVRVAHRLVGFNILAFDIPLTLIRSMLLGIEAPIPPIIRAKYNNSQVLDLYVGLGEKGSFKTWAKEMKIQLLAPGVDGSHVMDLYYNDPEKLRLYQESDVWGERELLCMGRGMFWE